MKSKQNTPIIKPSEEGKILLYAFRYSLGRQSYDPHSVIVILRRNWNKLSYSFKEKVVEEILEHKRLLSTLGGRIDEEDAWLGIINLFGSTEGTAKLAQVPGIEILS